MSILNLIPNFLGAFIILFWYYEPWQNRLKKKINPDISLRYFCWMLTIVQYLLVLLGGYLMGNYLKAICLNIALEYGILFNAMGKYSLDLYPIIDWPNFGIQGLTAKIGAILLGLLAFMVFILIQI